MSFLLDDEDLEQIQVRQTMKDHYLPVRIPEVVHYLVSKVAEQQAEGNVSEVVRKALEAYPPIQEAFRELLRVTQQGAPHPRGGRSIT